MVKTRKRSFNSAFRFPSKFNPSTVPSRSDVFLYYMYARENECEKAIASNTKDCYEIVATEVRKILDAFSFPTIPHEGIRLKIKRLVESATKLNKVPTCRRNTGSFKENLEKFPKMFDVCTCTCYENGIERSSCRCDVRIPIAEWDAFVNQKLKKNQLSRPDTRVTAARRRTAFRKSFCNSFNI